jgi:hypothetical protein
VTSTNVEVLSAAVHKFVTEPDVARKTGESARAAALERYGVERFLRDWDALIEEVT